MSVEDEDEHGELKFFSKGWCPVGFLPYLQYELQG